MLNNKVMSEEIKKFEKAGLEVVAIDKGGSLCYKTQQNNSNELCDSCPSFRLLPDPDPNDWFRDDDMKAVCLEVNGVIKGSLECPSEFINIHKPLYCPKLGRELNEQEKEIAARRLAIAKEDME